jgi:hypothetical protein
MKICPQRLLLAAAGAICMGTQARAAAGLLRAPYLQSVLDTSAAIVWVTDVPSLGKVRIAAAGETPRVVAEAEPGLRHVVRLTDLAPGTVHRYAVLDGEFELTDTFEFRTAPVPGSREVRVAVVGDSGSGDENELAVAGVVRAFEPDIFLHTGDMDYAGDTDKSVFGPFADIITRACFFPCRGNHDMDLVWDDLFVTPVDKSRETTSYYSFDWGDAHFVAVDSNHDAIAGGAQASWLDADLTAARASGRPWLILYLHEPPYTVGSYSKAKRVANEFIPPIADKYAVDLVLSGHDHNYQRTFPVRGDAVHDGWQDPEFVSPRGTVYVVTGGGGGVLYPRIDPAHDDPLMHTFRYAHHAVEMVIDARKLTLRAVSKDGEELDRFTLTKGEPRPELRLVRGDADLNGYLQLPDAIVILQHLFLGKSIECRPAADVAADVNASGLPIDIADPVYLLGFLFLGGPPPPAPFPDCAAPPGADDTGCTRSSCP